MFPFASYRHRRIVFLMLMGLIPSLCASVYLCPFLADIIRQIDTQSQIRHSYRYMHILYGAHYRQLFAYDYSSCWYGKRRTGEIISL